MKASSTMLLAFTRTRAGCPLRARADCSSISCTSPLRTERGATSSRWKVLRGAMPESWLNMAIAIAQPGSGTPTVPIFEFAVMFTVIGAVVSAFEVATAIRTPAACRSASSAGMPSKGRFIDQPRVV